MNADIKKAWLEALRSGDYTQAKEYLRVSSDSGDGFCCLGVLCDLHRKMTGQGKWAQVHGVEGPRIGYIVAGGDHSTSVLPQEVREWAGLPVNTGIDVNGGHLASLNDDGTSFKEIADIIEQHT